MLFVRCASAVGMFLSVMVVLFFGLTYYSRTKRPGRQPRVGAASYTPTAGSSSHPNHNATADTPPSFQRVTLQLVYVLPVVMLASTHYLPPTLFVCPAVSSLWLTCLHPAEEIRRNEELAVVRSSSESKSALSELQEESTSFT